MEFIKFDKLERVPGQLYGGASGCKIAVRYKNKVWMLKVEQEPPKKDMPVIHDILSEYIGSHVYEFLGMPVHETILGTYNGRLAVLCSDDAYPERMFEFREFRNSMMNPEITQVRSGKSVELSDVLQVINEHPDIRKDYALNRFWAMFVVDALIGNNDRNNGNWGFMFFGNHFEPYEVYDNGGCLNNKLSDEEMATYIEDNSIEEFAFVCPSKYTINGEQINPFEYIENNCNKYIEEALYIVSLLDMNEVNTMIDDLAPIVSPVRSSWYREVLSLRYAKLMEIRKKK